MTTTVIRGLGHIRLAVYLSGSEGFSYACYLGRKEQITRQDCHSEDTIPLRSETFLRKSPVAFDHLHCETHIDLSDLLNSIDYKSTVMAIRYAAYQSIVRKKCDEKRVQDRKYP